MPGAKKIQFETPASTAAEEDNETLTAIDSGSADAEAGRTVDAEAVRELLPKWIADSSTPKKH